MENGQTKLKVDAFLREHHLGALATVSPEGKPQCSTVYYDLTEDMNILFATRDGSRKFVNIEANANVALTVSDEDNKVTVQIEGVAKEVTDPEKIAEMIRRIVHVSDTESGRSWMPPVKLMQNGHFAVMEIETTWIRIGDFREKEEPYFSVVD